MLDSIHFASVGRVRVTKGPVNHFRIQVNFPFAKKKGGEKKAYTDVHTHTSFKRSAVHGAMNRLYAEFSTIFLAELNNGAGC